MDWFKGKSYLETTDFPIKHGTFQQKESLQPIHWKIDLDKPSLSPGRAPPDRFEVRTTHVTGCITDIGSTAGRAAILLLRRFCHKEGSGRARIQWVTWGNLGFSAIEKWTFQWDWMGFNGISRDFTAFNHIIWCKASWTCGNHGPCRIYVGLQKGALWKKVT